MMDVAQFFVLGGSYGASLASLNLCYKQEAHIGAFAISNI